MKNIPSHTPKKLVVIGNGMAAIRTIEELLSLTTDFEITMISKETQPSYNRIMLSPVLAGEKSFDSIKLHPEDWYQKNNITAILGKTVSSILRGAKQVELDDGRLIDYDRLILATGSNAFIIPFENYDHPDVIGFRTIEDVDYILEKAKHAKRIIVIGAGLLGLEAANGLNKQGHKVVVVHRADSILNNQLDKEAADLLQDFLEQQGIEFIMDADTQAIEIDDHQKVSGIKFKDGSTVAGELVIMAVGIRPNCELAKDAGLETERAIIVNDVMQTSDPAIYGIGECVQHRGNLFGLVAPIFDQAKILASQLAEFGLHYYQQAPTATSLKVTGVNLYSAGDFMGDEDSDILLYRDRSQSVYKRLVIKNNQLIGVVLYGDVQDGPAYFDLVINKTDISNQRNTLMFKVA